MNLTAIKALLALSVMVLVAACTSPIEANSDFDQRFDFSGVRKIAIQPVNRADPSSILFSDMQVSRINAALQEELKIKGFDIVADNADADVFLRWHLVAQEKTDVRSYNSASYYNCWRCGPAVSDVSVRQYTEGTLIVDIIDPMRNQSVWRSIIQSRLKAKSDPEKEAAFRREAAAAIFAQFPPQ